ncbi:hypothetical protein [uncultured Pseudoflavonifractor sp.]|uniref:hypothetical protein n=1 Tax=uncultured Pseudoflavonifractor sp. TaxID=1221379 RepID=UPI0025CFF87C|nr:hypothetical protein [uncultured Pseudoflavonifractor sp.]
MDGAIIKGKVWGCQGKAEAHTEFEKGAAVFGAYPAGLRERGQLLKAEKGGPKDEEISCRPLTKK